MASLFDRFKKTYMCKVKCYNCGTNMDCKIPKGVTIDAYLHTEGACCENCGNSTLRRIEKVRGPIGTEKPFKEYIPADNPNLPPPQQAQPRRQPQQTSRPRPPQFQSQPQRLRPQRQPKKVEVDYPVTEPVYEEEKDVQEPEWVPKKVNFWKGEEF